METAPTIIFVIIQHKEIPGTEYMANPPSSKESAMLRRRGELIDLGFQQLMLV